MNQKLSAEEIIKLSKEYGVLSKHTCFFDSIQNDNKTENELINISNTYVSNNTKSNFSMLKTGKHGHAKKIRINSQEENLYELIENNEEEEENNFKDINLFNEDYKTVNKIINEQNIENGFWDKNLFNDKLYNDLYQKIEDYLSNKKIKKEEFIRVCKTILTIYYLNEKIEAI